MLAKKKTLRGGVHQLLQDERVARAEIDGRALYAAVDLVAVLTGSAHPAELWQDLKRREPALADGVTVADLAGAETDALELSGVLRLIQSVDSPRADRLKGWILNSAVERIEEAQDPELALLRTRQEYEQQGYGRQWIDQRMRSVSARHELTGEWYRRGVRESEEFRALTNEMMRHAFGFDVESYRRYKGLFRTGHNLRDHMTDLELSLLTLAETTAVELHRARRSSGFDALLLDARDAGAIIARTRSDAQDHLGRAVVSASNHLPRRDLTPPRPPTNVAA